MSCFFFFFDILEEVVQDVDNMDEAMWSKDHLLSENDIEQVQ